MSRLIHVSTWTFKGGYCAYAYIYQNHFISELFINLFVLYIQIVDVETGKTLGTNQEGEVWVRGPQVTNGYHNLPAQTREMFLSDGWVRTGKQSKYMRHSLLMCIFNFCLILHLYINRLFAYCKGGNFNIRIWAWFGYFIC